MIARFRQRTLLLPLTLCAIILGSLPSRAQGWVQLAIPETLPTPDLLCAHFFHRDTGFVGGTAGATPVGKLYRTDDGGVTWQIILLPGTPKSINDIHFVSGTNFGVIVGDAGYVAITNNRGANWQLTAASPTSIWSGGGDIEGVYFKDQNNGFVVGKALGAGNGPRIARTANGGVTWINVLQTGTQNNLYDLDFFRANNAAAVGTGNLARKSITTDGGTTWEANATMGLPQTTSLSFYGFDAIDNTAIGYAVGGQVVPGPPFYGEVRKTTDFGASWQLTAMAGAGSLATRALNGVLAMNQSFVLVSGRNGKAYRTTDGGNTWTAETLPGTVGSSDLWRFSRTPTDHIYLVGFGGVVLMSSLGPKATFGATQLTFDKGCPSDSKTIQLTIGNTGSAALTIDSIKLTQPNPGVTFVITAKPTTIPAGGSGTVTLRADVAGNANPGLYSGSMVIYNNDENYIGANKVKVIPLSMSITTKTLTVNGAVNGNAGSLRVGAAFSKSFALTDVVTNNGECEVALNARLARGTDFSIDPPTNFRLASGQKGSIRLVFEPKQPCERYDTVIIEHDALSPLSPVRIPIVGIGLVQTFSTSPPDTLDFTGVPVGSPVTLDLKLQNNRFRAICLDTTNVYDVRITGPNAAEFTTTFIMPGTGRLPLGPLAEVPIPITATPAAPGVRVAYAIISQELSPSPPDTVVLLVYGLKPELSTLNSEIRFAITDVNGRRDSTVKDFLFNMSNGDARVLSASISGINPDDFTYNAPAPPFDVPTGGKKTIEVSFKPTATGVRTALLELVTDISPTPLRINLIGNATRPRGGVRGDLILFAATSVNDCRDTTVASFIYNNGVVPLRVTGISIGPDPSGTAADPAAFELIEPLVPPELTIAPGDSALVKLRFCPKSPRPYFARLILASNIDATPFNVQLIGSGRSSRVISLDSIRFAATRVLTTRDTVISRFLFNTESGPLAVDSITITGADAQSFTLLGPKAPFVIARGRDTSISIRFNPRRRDRHAAFLKVYTSQGEELVILAGPAIYPLLAIEPDNPASLRVRIGTSRRLRINIINIGDDSARVENAQLNGSAEYTNVTVDPLPRTVMVGDTVKMSVDFTPAHFCNADADVLLRGEGIRGIYAIADTVVRFSGIGSSSFVSARAPEINFGIRKVSTTVDSVMDDFLGNIDFTGATALSCIDSTQIDSMVITGPGSGAFSIITPASPLTPRPLAAGAIEPLSIRFGSAISGLKTADLLVYFEGAGDSVLRIPLIGANSTLPIEYGPAKNMFQIDFGNVRIGSRRDSTFTAMNISSSPMRIDDLSSTLPAEMRIIAPTGGVELVPSVPVEITAAFTPIGSPGTRIAYTKFRNGSIVDSSFRMIGNGVDEALASETASIDFGARLAGTQADTTAMLLNEPNDVITEAAFLDSVTIDTALIASGAAWFDLLSFPRGIGANRRDSIALRFRASGVPGRRNGVARIYYNGRTVAGSPEYDSIDIALTGIVQGEGTTLHAALGPGANASPGDIISYPITLSGDLDGASFDTLDVTIGFRKTMLKPMRVIPAQSGVGGTLDAGPDLKSTRGSAAVRLTSSGRFTAGTLADVEFQVLLPDSMESMVRYDSIGAFNRADIFFTTDSARFTISEFCDAEGRLIRFDSLLSFASKPNPATRVTSFAYTLPAVVHAQLSIYDAAGSEVARLVDGEQSPGYYIIPFDATSLASGTYYCVLTAGRFTKTLTLRLIE